MRKGIASGLAAMAIAAVVSLSSADFAEARRHRHHHVYRDDYPADRTEPAERPAGSVSQRIDRADARIANFKAALDLSEAQAKHWPSLESALHAIAVKRAKGSSGSSLAGDDESRTGRTAGRSSSAATHPTEDEDEDVDAADRAEPDPIRARRDDIGHMRSDADAHAARAVELRQIADAATPLYDRLDQRQRRRFAEFLHDELRENDGDGARPRRR